MTSKKQFAANKKNAQKSTGPKTTEGKKMSSKNAGKHLVFANEVVAEGEDPTLFAQLFKINLLKSYYRKLRLRSVSLSVSQLLFGENVA